MDNAFFSLPLQKTGHSRRFGRFTHGALSYQDLPPPAGMGSAPPPRSSREGAVSGGCTGLGTALKWVEGLLVCPVSTPLPPQLQGQGCCGGSWGHGGRQPAAMAVMGQLAVCWAAPDQPREGIAVRTPTGLWCVMTGLEDRGRFLCQGVLQ